VVTIEAPSRQDTVRGVMTRPVVTVAPSDSLLKARDVMTQTHTSQVVVIDQRSRPIGLISKRDIARFLLEDPTNRNLNEIPVSEAQSKSVSTIRPDVLVLNTARLFDTDNLAYAVVANEDPLVGIVTQTDLCRYYSQHLPQRFKVKHFMQSDFIFAKSTYPVVHVAQAIVFRQPSVPVIDEQLIGILTLSDILSLREKIPHAQTLNPKDRENAALISTRDVMTRNPTTVHQDADLAEAAAMIVTMRIGSLPVTNDGSKVVGLIAKHEIVKALGRTDSKVSAETKGN